MSDDGSAEGAASPLPEFYFSVDFGDGRPQRFSEVSGLADEVEPIEYRHGDSPVYAPIGMPGLRSVADVTLKNGAIAKDSVFWDWYDQAKLNVIKRQTVIISLHGEAGSPKMSWTLTNAWPLRMAGTDIRPDEDEAAIESLEIAYETLEVTAA